MRKNFLGLVVTICLVFFSVSAYAQKTVPETRHELTPYVWGTNIDGRIGVQNIATDVNAEFKDIVKVVDQSYMINYKAISGLWTLNVDYSYTKFKDSFDLPSTTINAESVNIIGDVGVQYRLHEDSSTELLIGGRYFYVENLLELSGVTAVTHDKEWMDPFVGIKHKWEVNDKFFIVTKADIGGFGVASDLIWNVTVSANYMLNENVTCVLGYRYMDVDYHEDGFIYDISSQGIGAGVTFKL